MSGEGLCTGFHHGDARSCLRPTHQKDASMNHDSPASRLPAWLSWSLVAAGIYNILWGTWVILFPNQFFDWSGIERPNHPQLWQCIGMIVGVYGIGYWIAAADPLKHWPIVLVGFLGKILGPIGFLQTAISGVWPWSAGWINITNDVIWWVPFGWILYRRLLLAIAPPYAGEIASLTDELARAQVEFPLAEANPTAVANAAGESGQAPAPAPSVTLQSLSQSGRVLVLFVRHAGCTFCREALADLRQQLATLRSRGLSTVLVHMGDAADGHQLLRDFQLNGVGVISDPDRRLYRAFDLRRGGFQQLFGPAVIWRALAGGAFFRYGVGRLVGDGMQLGGLFLLDHGQIVAAQRNQHSGERPELEQLTCHLRPA